MTTSDPFAEYVKPLLAARLRASGLDVEFIRGVGDHMTYRDDTGETEVLDLIGGFGASLFGHNHPALVARARQVLDAARPFNAQVSVRAAAGRLGQRLSAAAERAAGRPYVVHFANSGAEAVEAALKHAEIERRRRVDAAIAALGEMQHEVRRRLRDRSARISEAVFQRAARLFGLVRVDGIDELFLRLYRLALDTFEAPPMFLAVEGAFHGKTSGSLKLTFRPEYHAPWRSLGPTSAFLKIGDPESLREAIARNTLRYVALEVDGDGEYQLVERAMINIAACFVEPIQGEGGVREVPTEYLRALRAAADLHGFPLVVDEIQSGMGRTGRFFASEHAGVIGDYYLLSKALGGGLAKISALLVDRRRYDEEFGYLHTSTFADDDFSSEVALAGLDLLEADGGALIAECARKGERFLARLRELMARYPDQIREVRGRGLMIGVEVAGQEASASPLIRVISEQELLGFILSGWLLREEGIRVAPTLSARATLRLEPSAFVDDAAIERFCGAMGRLAEILRAGDAYRLLRFLVGRAGQPEPTRSERRRPAVPPKAEPGAAKVGFLAHFLGPGELVRWDPTLAPMSDDECDEFLGKTRGMIAPFVAGRTALRSALGSHVDATLIGLPFTPAQVLEALRSGDDRWAMDLIDQGVELARRQGCQVVGFGGYTSILTNNCRRVVASDIAVTTGNALTAAAALEAAHHVAARLGLTRRTLGVVGAAGNIGRVLAEVAADWVDAVVLIGRPGTERRLREAAAHLYASAARQAGSLLARSLRQAGVIDDATPLGGPDAGERLRERADRLLGEQAPIRIATDMMALRGCNVIISASNAARPIILPQHLAADVPMVVSDVAVPRDVDPSVIAARPDAVVLKGGIVRAPLEQRLEVDGLNLPPGEVYGCLAETLLMGLAGIGENFSFGALDPHRIRRIRNIALEHGFSLEEQRATADQGA